MNKKFGRMMPWMIAGMMLLAIGCRKEYSGVYTPPLPEKEFEVVTTGHIIDFGGDVIMPVYWINNKEFPMETGDKDQAAASGITKKGNDLYFAGGYRGTNPSGKTEFMPCYWINSQKFNLPVDGLKFKDECQATDLAWFNDTLYILGDADEEAVIWKVKGNFASVNTLPGKKPNEITFLKGMNLQLYNDQLYFASNHYIKKNNGDFIVEAGYFTIDKVGKPEYHVLETNLGDAVCYFLSVSSKGLYVSGQIFELGHQPGVLPKPVMWSQHGRLNVFSQLDPVKEQLNEVAVDGQGKLYANIFDHQTFKPIVWKTQENAGNVELLNPLLPGNAIGYVENLATAGDDVAYAYSWAEGTNKYYAGYVFRNKQVLLESDSSLFKTLTRTSIFER